MMETIKQYEEENKRYYEKVERQLAEIRSTLNYVVTEQGKQRIASMNMAELLQAMNENIAEMRASLDVLLMETVGDTEWIIN